MNPNSRKRRQTHPTMAKTSGVTFSTPHGQDIVFGQDNKSASSQSDVSDKENTGTVQDSNSQKTIGSGYGTGLVDYRKNGKVISTSRIIFFATFAVFAVVTATLTYYFLRAGESAQFKKQVCNWARLAYDLF